MLLKSKLTLKLTWKSKSTAKPDPQQTAGVAAVPAALLGSFRVGGETMFESALNTTPDWGAVRCIESVDTISSFDFNQLTHAHI